MVDAGFSPISMGIWTEHCDSPRRLASHIASQLEEGGCHGYANALRRWVSHPDAEFRQTWRYAVTIKLGEE